MRMMEAMIDEEMAVGRARGIAFPDGLLDGTRQMVQNFPFESKSSMLEDLERGRRLELPWLRWGRRAACRRRRTRSSTRFCCRTRTGADRPGRRPGDHAAASISGA
jgi:hypothetical protein